MNRELIRVWFELVKMVQSRLFRPLLTSLKQTYGQPHMVNTMNGPPAQTGMMYCWRAFEGNRKLV